MRYYSHDETTTTPRIGDKIYLWPGIRWDEYEIHIVTYVHPSLGIKTDRHPKFIAPTNFVFMNRKK